MVSCHPFVRTKTVQTSEPLPACTRRWSYWSAEYCAYIDLFPVLESQGSAVHKELWELGVARLWPVLGPFMLVEWHWRTGIDRESAQFKCDFCMVWGCYNSNYQLLYFYLCPVISHNSQIGWKFLVSTYVLSVHFSLFELFCVFF